MTSSAIMLNRLRDAGLNISSEAEIHRTRAGRHQRAAGAWSWFVFDPRNSHIEVGSHYPLSRLVNSKIEISWDRFHTCFNVDPIR